jgi:hypothetical protein
MEGGERDQASGSRQRLKKGHGDEEKNDPQLHVYTGSWGLLRLLDMVVLVCWCPGGEKWIISVVVCALKVSKVLFLGQIKYTGYEKVKIRRTDGMLAAYVVVAMNTDGVAHRDAVA